MAGLWICTFLVTLRTAISLWRSLGCSLSLQIFVLSRHSCSPIKAWWSMQYGALTLFSSSAWRTKWWWRWDEWTETGEYFFYWCFWSSSGYDLSWNVCQLLVASIGDCADLCLLAHKTHMEIFPRSLPVMILLARLTNLLPILAHAYPRDGTLQPTGD